MTDTAAAPAPASRSASSLALRLVILAGFAWSLFGAYQFVRQTFTDEAGLIAGGMTPAQAELYAGLPMWMSVVFAIGTFGGALGCAMLFARQRGAVPVLGASLAAYLALFIGDIIYGVFAAFGAPQVVVLSLVVLIAAGLLGLGAAMQRRGLLA